MRTAPSSRNRLLASPLRLVAVLLRRGARRLARRTRRAVVAAPGVASHLIRVLRRFDAQRRARRQKPTETEQP